MNQANQTNNYTKEIREVMARHEVGGVVIEEFLRRVDSIAAGYSGKIAWKSVRQLGPDDIFDARKSGPSRSESESKTMAGKLAVIRLNGGLGTSMGLSQAKTLIRVRGKESFLSILLHQMQALRRRYGSDTLPLLFMNSFNTSDDTLAVPGVREINAGCRGDLPVEFLQNRVVRILAESYLPLGDGSDAAHWCPPGHGDIYLALEVSHTLDRLLKNGYEVAFVANGDNLGATVDLDLVGHFLNEKLDFAMEVTAKTAADLKGGSLYRHLADDGTSHIGLLEIAQVEKEHIDGFQDLNLLPYFNTNNLYVHLESLRDRLRSGGLPLPVIVNPKEVDGKSVLQLETAMGAAIGSFGRTMGFVVDRSRFAPVKSCSDLLVRRSDAFTLDRDDSTLQLNALRRSSSEPLVRLSDDYKEIGNFDHFFAKTPSLLGAKELQIEGPILFDVPVEIEGRVEIVNRSGKELPISRLGRSRLSDERVEL